MFTLNTEWRKATRSGANGQCVEARTADDFVEVRNSRTPDDGSLRFTTTEWAKFIDAVALDGEFRLP